MRLIRHDLFILLLRRRHLVAARSFARRGAWQDAKISYRKLLDSSNASPAVWLQYGHACKESGDVEGAAEAYRRCALLAPHDSEPHRHLAHLHKGRGQRSEAIDAFLRAFAAEPSDTALHAELLSLGLTPREISVFSTISAWELGSLTSWERSHLPPRLVSDLVEALSLPVVRLLARKRRWVLVQRAYRALLAVSPQRFRLSIQLGHALKEVGAVGEAEQAYHRAITFAPWYADAYLHLGHIAKSCGDMGLARYRYAQAWRLDPSTNGLSVEVQHIGLPTHEQSQIFRKIWAGDLSDDTSIHERFRAIVPGKLHASPPASLSLRGKSIWYRFSQSVR